VPGVGPGGDLVGPGGGTIGPSASTELVGVSTSSGALIRRATRVLGGTSGSSGAFSYTSARFPSGSSDSSGALSERPTIRAAGAATSSGSLRYMLVRRVGGTTTSSGALITIRYRPLTASSTPSGALTATKIPGYFSVSRRPFALGWAGSRSRRPFALIGEPASSISRRPFALEGSVGSFSRRPFALEGLARSVSRRPFALEGGAPIEWGSAPPPPATSLVYTALALAALPGDMQITLRDATGVHTGTVIIIGTSSETVVADAVSGNVVTLTAPIEGSAPVLTVAPGDGSIDLSWTPTGWLAGSPVRYESAATTSVPVSVTVGDPGAQPGDTIVPVTSTDGLQAGEPVLIAGHVYVIESVGAGFIVLTSPLLGVVPVGSGVNTSWAFLPAALVYDKGGHLLGSLHNMTVTSPPSREIGSVGSGSAKVPADDLSASLLWDDRIVVLQTSDGEEPWAGAATVQTTEEGDKEASLEDALSLLAGGPNVEMKSEVSDGTPASEMYRRAIALHNTRAAADGEVTWDVDASGTHTFHGDIDFKDGDVLALINHIAERSDTEFRFGVRQAGSLFVPVLVGRDRLSAPSAPTLKDQADPTVFDPAANIINGSIRYVRDPTPIVHEIKLTGATTQLEDCLPDYAKWAVHNVTPEVTVRVDPGQHRRRARLDVSVEWGLSHSVIAELCAATLDAVWDLYYSFLRAIHDIEGRPYHDGYVFTGPSEYLESQDASADALSRAAFHTRRQLVETFPDTPAAAVMISDAQVINNLHEWLIVNYNRRTAVQSVGFFPFTTVAGASITRWQMSVSATTTFYTASGGRITGSHTFAPDPDFGQTSTGNYVESFSTRLWDPFARRYRSLRRIIAGVFFGEYLDPADPDLTFTNLGSGAAIDLGTLGELVGKIYDFERFNIDLWDPFRDGIGALLSLPTIFAGQVTTRARWHRVSYNAGTNATAQLMQGIGAASTDAQTKIEVDTIFGWPTPESKDFPFMASIDDGPDREDIKVIGMSGTEWTVLRGQNGTAAILHEPGAPVRRLGGATFDGIVFPFAWPEGQAWAETLLARLSRARSLLNVRVSMKRVRPSQLMIGAPAPFDIVTERVGSGTGRIIGSSPDPYRGETEIIVAIYDDGAL
jgi:hypothetical protein